MVALEPKSSQLFVWCEYEDNKINIFHPYTKQKFVSFFGVKLNYRRRRLRI